MKSTRHGKYMVYAKIKEIKTEAQNQAHKRFCRYSKALAEVKLILLELSYEVYKDQDYAEKVGASKGWDVKMYKQLRRETRRAFRATRKKGFTK